MGMSGGKDIRLPARSLGPECRLPDMIFLFPANAARARLCPGGQTPTRAAEDGRNTIAIDRHYKDALMRDEDTLGALFFSLILAVWGFHWGRGQKEDAETLCCGAKIEFKR